MTPAERIEELTDELSQMTPAERIHELTDELSQILLAEDAAETMPHIARFELLEAIKHACRASALAEAGREGMLSENVAPICGAKEPITYAPCQAARGHVGSHWWRGESGGIREWGLAGPNTLPASGCTP